MFGYGKKVCVILLSVVFLFSCKTNTKKRTVQEKKYSFSFKPIVPVNGKLMGVVELGASGFNSFIVEVDTNNNWQLKKKEYGNSLITEGMTNTTEVNSKLRTYIEHLVTFGVPSNSIHFVVSSGAMKEDLSKIIVKEIENLGRKVVVVTPKEEARYALQTVLPTRYKDSSFVVDLGSGNTKISFTSEEGIQAFETYGSKYYQKAIEDSLVYDRVKEIVSKIPEEKRKYCFFLGGVPSELAKLDQNHKRYIVLRKNVDTYQALAKERGKKVQSGLTIYQAILDGTHVEHLIFDWDAYFTIGFLLSLQDKK